MSVHKKFESSMESFIFGSRWLQAPLYVGLVISAGVYSYKFAVELIHLVVTAPTISEEMVMLSVLTLVDITMVANLLNMVVIGGYATFVSRLNLSGHEDRPDWLEKIDAGTLKIKLSSSLISVSGIHLLKSFINVAHKDPEHIKFQLMIHGMFLLSTVVLAVSERIMHPKKH